MFIKIFILIFTSFPEGVFQLLVENQLQLSLGLAFIGLLKLHVALSDWSLHPDMVFELREWRLLGSVTSTFLGFVLHLGQLRLENRLFLSGSEEGHQLCLVFSLVLPINQIHI